MKTNTEDGTTVYSIATTQSEKSAKQSTIKRDHAVHRAPTRFPFWKLSVNVATFAIFNFLQVAFSVFMIDQEGCYFLRHLPQMLTIVYLVK